MKQKRFFLRSSLVGAFLCAITAGGLMAGALSSQTMVAVAAERYQDLQIFTKVLNLVQQYYVEDVDTHKLIYGAIKGMLSELDPHTNFLPPDIYKEFESETAGEFGGIGIEITVQNDVLTVISPIEDTPAWDAGIQAGDKIVEINGESTKGLSLAEAAQRMRGKQGSKVKMGIYREGFEKPKVFEVARAVVKMKSVKYTDLGDGYAYIRLTSFIENSGADMEKAIKAHIKNNKVMRGLIIDLRRNPGGLLDQAVKISNLFLDHGVIVSTIGRNPKDKEVIYAKKENAYMGFPVIALMNEYSASAAEILAGALQDNRRALIMGQTSFGKGSVQSVVKLGDGSGLKLTVARYYTPSGRSIQSEGIKPDVIVDDVDAEAFRKAVVKHEVHREQDMSHHLLGTREQEEKTAKTGKAMGSAKQDQDAMNFWWKDTGNKKKSAMTPKEKLLSDDFQALQAYNYLRAWKSMESFGGAVEQAHANNGSAAAAVPDAPVTPAAAPVAVDSAPTAAAPGKSTPVAIPPAKAHH
jgi:carboxyl-terminal processing protease